jgi:hypothetical protein
MLSKEAFLLSHNFVVNQMTLYPRLYSNPLAVLDHLFFSHGNGYQEFCEEKGMIALFDVLVVTKEDIENEARNSTSDILYDLYAHKYSNMSRKDIIEVIFADEIKQYNFKDIFQSDFNLEANIQTHFNKIKSVYKKVLKRNIEEQIYFQSFDDKGYMLYPFAYNDNRLLELLIITARYKIGLMEILAKEVDYNIASNKHYIKTNEMLEIFKNKN